MDIVNEYQLFIISPLSVFNKIERSVDKRKLFYGQN
jgi:hypothetical protein